MFGDRKKVRPSIFYKPKIEDDTQSLQSLRTTIFSRSIVYFDEDARQNQIILSASTQVNEPPIRLFDLHIDEDKLVEYGYHIENAQKWLLLPGKDGIFHKFPTQSILPKVQLTRVVPKKTLPRDVEVDRRRRQYARISLEDELEKAGFTAQELMPTEEQYLMLSEHAFKHFMPLSFFDDNNFDIHSQSAWLKLGVIEDGTVYPLPAKAFLPVNQSLMEYVWQYAAISSYNPSTEKWTAMALADECIYEIPKVQFIFLAENPHHYIERLKYAIEQRNTAENILMMETIVDCVMLQEMVEDHLRPNAIVERLMSKVQTDPEFFKQLRTEIYVLFEHLMIYYEFEKYVKFLPKEFPKFSSELIRSALPKAYPSILGECDRRDVKSLKVNIKARRKSVLTTTLYYTKMGVEAMMHVVTDCQYIETLTLFVYTFSKTLTLPDFILTQQQNSTTVANYLTNFWPSKIANGVIQVLRALGKGWLDISLDKWTVYNMSKISRFIAQVKFRMQESIQVLLEDSMTNFMNYLLDPCIQFFPLTESYKWTSDFIETEFPSNRPVFSLILSISDERQAVYSIDPEEFAPALREVFKKSLDKLKSIRCIDADTMSHLRFAPNVCILTVELIEDLYIKSDSDLHLAYTKAIIPLRSYAEKYDYFVDFYLLNIQQYMTKYRADKKPSMEVKQDILTHKRLKEETREILPATIVIGPFQINIDILKQYLIKKRIEVVRRIFDYYVDRMYDTNEQLLERCAQTYQKIHQRPQSIEHLYEIRDFAATVPEVVEQLRADIQIMWLEYDMLDSFFYNLPDHQFAMKWEAYAWPKNILDRLSTLRDEQRIDIEDFRRQHLAECTGFEERLESLNDEIQAFSLQFNPEKVHEVAVEIKKTYRVISDLEKTGETLRYRQELFELEPFSLEFLESIMESFLPYKNLWYACLDLVKLEESTLGNPIVFLELDDIWEAGENIRASLKESIQVFHEKPEIQDVAHYYIAELDKFIPKYNAIKDMRNENWLFLHWQELANRTGLDIKYSNAMNFQYCIRKGILDYLDLVHEISVRATDEADAIREAFLEEERRKREEEEAILRRKALRKCRTDIV